MCKQFYSITLEEFNGCVCSYVPSGLSYRRRIVNFIKNIFLFLQILYKIKSFSIWINCKVLHNKFAVRRLPYESTPLVAIAVDGSTNKNYGKKSRNCEWNQYASSAAAPIFVCVLHQREEKIFRLLFQPVQSLAILPWEILCHSHFKSMLHRNFYDTNFVEFAFKFASKLTCKLVLLCACS